MKNSSLILLLSMMLALPSVVAIAEDGQPDLPSDSRVWINSSPVSLKQLTGKAVVLMFFEEDCPRCREGMKERMEISKKFANEPVFFVAISSGTTRQEMESYVKQVGVTWPVVLDPDRSLESAMGVNEISLSNIYQFKYVDAGGELKRANSFDLDAIAKDALVGAAWDVAPDQIPDSLKSEWRAVELKNFSPAAIGLKKAVNSKDEETQAAGELLMGVVSEQLDAAMEEAAASVEADNLFEAYQQYTAIEMQFDGYEAADKAGDEKKRLARDPAVRKEQTLFRKIEVVIEGIRKRGANKGSVSTLNKIVEDNPDTAAAKRAEEVLEALNKATPESPTEE